MRLSIPYDLILCIRLRARSLWPACGLVWRTFNAISARSGYGRSPLALVQVSSGVPARGFNSVGSYLGCKTTKLLCVPVWRSMVDTVVQQLGRLDIAVNNAGLNRNAAAEDTPEADWDMTFGLNTKGLFLCCQVAPETCTVASACKHCCPSEYASHCLLLPVHNFMQALIAFNCVCIPAISINIFWTCA